MEDSLLERNLADYGGAVEMKKTMAHCIGSTISFNRARKDGGAWWAKNQSGIDFDECTVMNTYAEWNAGGLWIEDSEFNASFSQFGGNHAQSRDGGAIDLCARNGISHSLL